MFRPTDEMVKVYCLELANKMWHICLDIVIIVIM